MVLTFDLNIGHFPSIHIRVSGRTLLLVAISLPWYLLCYGGVCFVKDFYTEVRPLLEAIVENQARVIRELQPTHGWCLDVRDVWKWSRQSECIVPRHHW